MAKAALRELFNRLRWDATAEADGVVLDVRVREGGVATIEAVGFASILEIMPAGVAVADGTFLPYHRIVAVRRHGTTIWRKREEGESDEA